MPIARGLTIQSEEPTMYFTKTKIEAMFKKERERVATTPTTFDLKPPYSEKVVAKQFYQKTKYPSFRSLMVEGKHEGPCGPVPRLLKTICR